MNRPGIWIAVGFCVFVATLLAEPAPQNSREAQKSTGNLAYHDQPPLGALPPVLDAHRFQSSRPAFVAYYLASKIKDTFYQVPCYCPCNKSQGHQSLLDCFADKHGSTCLTCQKEAVFCYLRNKQGRTPAEIRLAMGNGDIQKIHWETEIDKAFSEISIEDR
jgi:hypothetical protein